MAKPNKPKRVRRRQTEFHEALPLPLVPVGTLPYVTEHFEETAAHLRQSSRDWLKSQTLHHRLSTALKALAINLRPGLGASGQRLTHMLGRVVQFTIHHGRVFGLAAVRTLQTIGLATADFGLRGLNRIWISSLMAGNAAGSYMPAVGRDAGMMGRYLWKTVRSRPAKIGMISLVVIGSLGLGTALTILAGNTLKAYAADLSSQAVLMSKKKTGTTILDRNGTVLFEGYGAQSSPSIALKDLPESLKQATLAAEDPEFYNHPGVSWQGTLRAAWVDITHRSAQEGGSTLTQQLVKNMLLTHDKNFVRKFKEILLSARIEQQYSKDQILEMYLNGIYYGQGAYGVEAAAQTYFHKSARDLNMAESALIAGLPLGPSRFDPNYNLEAAIGRRDFVLNRMAALGLTTKAAADQAKVPFVLASNTPVPPEGAITIHARQIKVLAPHFVFYVLNQLRASYGDELVEQGGITVRTTLDYAKQEQAQAAVSRRISELSSHHVTNAGLVSIEPGTGDVISMVGSVDYNAPGFGNVNVTLAQLQPGSSFKPFAYITAFKKGWHGATTVEDTPLFLPNGDGTIYAPKNYDLEWHGTVTLRRALDNSLNIPAVKVLLHAGLGDTIQTARDLGVASLKDQSNYGPALVLGGAEVKPIEMATAYATLANGGTYVAPRSILTVSDRLGKDITKPTTVQPKNVLDPRIAYMITHILSDNNSRAPEFPVNSPLKLSRPAAAKTGTTNDFRDNWTVGYTPQLATAVWVGNNDHSAMQNVDGITGAAPIWHDYMEAAHSGLPVQQFAVPEGIVMADVCTNGGIADGFSTGVTEVFLNENVPSMRCNRPAPEPKPEEGAAGEPQNPSDNSGPGNNPDTTSLPPAARRLLERLAPNGIQ